MSSRKSTSSLPAAEPDRPAPPAPRPPLTPEQAAKVNPLVGGPLWSALEMQRRGFPVFHLTPAGKPAIKDFPNRATRDPAQIMAWMTQEIPGGHNVEIVMAYGIAMGHPLPGGGYSIGWDCDIKDGKDGYADWFALGQDLPASTLSVQTKSGGIHFIFAAAVAFAPKDGLTTPALKVLQEAAGRPPGIDVKGLGGYLVGPGSVLNGRAYKVAEDLAPAPLPAELAALLKPADTSPRQQHTDPFDYEDDPAAMAAAAAVIARWPLDKHQAFPLACELKDVGCSEERAEELLLEWGERCSPAATPETLRVIVTNAFKSRNAPGSKHPKASMGEVAARIAQDPPPTGGSGGGGEGPSDIPPPPKTELPDDPNYMLNEKGRPLNNLFNAVLMLKLVPAFAGLVAYDQMALAPMLLRPFDDEAEPDTAFPRLLEDHDMTEIQRRMQRRGLASLSDKIALQAVLLLAWEHRYHPVRDWLATLKWDGRERVRWLFTDYLGADSSVYVQRVAIMFAVGLVARTMKPGCKHDAMPVLEGITGIGKSEFCRRLVGEQWLGDNLPPISGKDSSQYLRGKWLVELAELAAADKVETSHLKAFLSRPTEDYRAPYGRLFAKEPRQCAFIGTVNRVAYLKDETGDRRYWPVEVSHFLADLLTQDRSQIFAEALDLFNRGETWWPSREFQRDYATPEQADKYDSDIWEGAIAAYLAKVDRATVQMVALWALGLELKQIKKAEQNRITAVLEHLGWKRGKRGPKGERFWEPRK